MANKWINLSLATLILGSIGGWTIGGCGDDGGSGGSDAGADTDADADTDTDMDTDTDSDSDTATDADSDSDSDTDSDIDTDTDTDADGGTDAGTQAPQISEVSPSWGIVASAITVKGQQFGATQGSGTVSVGGESATPTSWTAGEIVVNVPMALYPGQADVVVTVDSMASNAVPFEVMLPRTVYVNRNEDEGGSNSIAAFAMSDSGALSELAGSPYSTGELSVDFGGNATSIAVHRGTRRVFATNSSTVAVFDIDPVSGALTAVDGSPFDDGGSESYGIAIDKSGARVFVVNFYTHNVSVLDVAGDGKLSQVGGSPFDAPSASGIDTPQLLHNDSLLTVTDEGEHLFVYSVDKSTGVLTPVDNSPFATGAEEWSSRADPTGTWLYVPDTNYGTLSVFQFNTTTGAPSQISGSPFATGLTSGRFDGLAFTPDGDHLYLGNSDINEIVALSVSGGAPTPIADSPFVVDGVTLVSSLEVTRDGKFLVATHEDEGQISVFELESDGAPTPVSGSPFSLDIGSASGLAVGE